MNTRLALLSVLSLVSASSPAKEWIVPLAGNTYRTAPTTGGEGFLRDGRVAWSELDTVFSVFFRTDRPASLDLALEVRVPDGISEMALRTGSTNFAFTLDASTSPRRHVGRIAVTRAGYVRVDLQGLRRTGAVFAELRDLVVSSDAADLSLDYVKSNEDNMFYWGRRGPSVHLGYRLPADRQFGFAYSEITVPQGQDPIGSYFMANGFAEGYFGIQVNSPNERRVLFSVWSPFHTDNPREIPEDQKIVALAKGPGVHLGEFGDEGSGGQSYLVYPWKSGVTYRFLTEIEPDGRGNTRYTSWFGDKHAAEWHLVASFLRPKTDTHLRGFHSFLESFQPTTGHVGRQGNYGNVWARDTLGQWHEITQARFSVDPTGKGRHRLDYTGGTVGPAFFLRNCGFFDETGTPGTTFTRASTATDRPDIAIENLPRG